jgi:hypothetical protein
MPYREALEWASVRQVILDRKAAEQDGKPIIATVPVASVFQRHEGFRPALGRSRNNFEECDIADSVFIAWAHFNVSVSK